MTALFCLKTFLGAAVVLCAMAILSLKSASLLVQNLCVATGCMQSGKGPTMSEMELAEAYVMRSRLVPKRFTGRASRKMLALLNKYAG